MSHLGTKISITQAPANQMNKSLDHNLSESHQNKTSDMQMKKPSFVSFAIQTSVAMIFSVFFVLLLPLMYLRALMAKKSLYRSLENCNSLDLKVFNIRNKLIKYLPLNTMILSKKVALIGTTLFAKSSNSNYPGLISLHSLRSLSGIDHQNTDDTNREYHAKAGTAYDIKLVIRFLVASIFTSKRKVFKNRLELLGVRFLNTTIADTVVFIQNQITLNRKSLFFFVNADTLNKAYKKSSFRRLLNTTPYVLPDGIGVKMACNMLNTPLKQNVNGTDLFPYICKMAQKEQFKIFLYGAKEGIATTMKNKITEQYPGIQIVGAINGYDLHDNEVINMMNHSNADIVLVAKGAPLQEEWINTHANRISAPIIMGVGGLFDFYSGTISRAPIWMREIGLEWAYRLIQEPKRMWKRYIVGNPLFVWRVFLWNRKQKQIQLQQFRDVVAPRRPFGFLFDFSLLSQKFYPIGKRIMDIAVASVAILLFSPILVSTALLIRLESRGSIIFSQKRVGKGGKLFDVYKFRSMVQNAEDLKKELKISNESEDGVIFKMKDDPRITCVGKFIRKWSIDELPQLFNVLFGDMSLVGPRPPVPSEVSEYSSDDLKRLHIVPGITCIWQISGRSEIPFKQQVDLDKKYISTHSLWTDIKILFGTIPAVLFQKGAY